MKSTNHVSTLTLPAVCSARPSKAACTATSSSHKPPRKCGTRVASALTTAAYGWAWPACSPYSAIDLFIFENCKHLVLARKARLQRCHEEDVDMGNFMTGVIGASSGAISATVVYPINVLRTRLQAQGTVLHPPTYDGVVDVTRKTLRAEGVRGLFRGVTPNLLKVAPAVSISYIVYENSKALLGLH